MLNSKIVNDGPDHVYYNLNYANTSNDFIPLKFTDYRSEGILDLSKHKYNLTVARFLIPGTGIPLFAWPTDPDAYKVTFGKSPSLRPSVSLIYVPNNASGSRNVYSIQQFVNIINTALATGFADFNAAFPGLVTTAPYMTFDSTTQLFSLIAEANYAINNVNVYFNSNLFLFFDNFEAYYNGTNLSNGSDYQIIIKNNGNNYLSAIPLPPYGPQLTPAGYKMTQEYSNTYLLMSFRSLVVTSSKLPLRSEFYPVSSTNTDMGGQYSNTQLAILTDFEPGFESVGDVRSYMHYQPNLYRWIDLIGTGEVKNADINVFWVDNRQVLHPLLLPPGEYFSIKILFSKKDKNNFSN